MIVLAPDRLRVCCGWVTIVRARGHCLPMHGQDFLASKHDLGCRQCVVGIAVTLSNKLIEGRTKMKILCVSPRTLNI